MRPVTIAANSNIAATEASTYKNVVNALDEMLICNIKTYTLMDASNDESNAMKP